MKIAVTGSRGLRVSVDEMRAAIVATEDSLMDEVVVVLHGDCPTGADSVVRAASESLGIRSAEYKADWDRLKKAAGPIRNRKMISCAPDALVAFWDGALTGTGGMIEMARKAGIRVYMQKGQQ